jgi:hypothetical protein
VQARRRATKLAADLAQSPSKLRDYLVEVILQTTMIGSVTGILAGIFFGIANGLAWTDWTSDDPWRLLISSLTVLGQAASIFGAMWIVRLAMEALTVARQLGSSTSSESARLHLARSAPRGLPALAGGYVTRPVCASPA